MVQRALQGFYCLNRTLSYVCNQREYFRVLLWRQRLHTMISRPWTLLEHTSNKQYCSFSQEAGANAVVNSTRRLCSNLFSSPFISCKQFETLVSLKRAQMYATKVKSNFSLENKLFRDYLQSLEEEYNSLNELKEINPYRFGHVENMNLQKLRPTVEIFQHIQQKYSELKELEVLAREEEMKNLAGKEIQDILSVIHDMEEELVSSLTPPEQVDNCDIILEVECGAGGQESMLFAEEIFNMYEALAARLGWKFDVIEKTESKPERGGGTGFHSASASISGYGVYQQMKYEGGVHRVQRVPTTEAKGRIHTSTVTVAILPQPKEIDIQIQKKDLQIEAMRSSGPGGQHVNKVNSAVRIVHIPSGIVSECQETRSYGRNEELAMKKLKSRLYEKQLKEQTSQTVSQRKIQVGNKDRSEKIRTYNFMQDRITDHRISHSVFNMALFMTAGIGLSEIMEKLQKGAKYEAIESKMEEFQKSLSHDKERLRKKR